MADSYLAVLPPHTEAVVFSIHGALSASVSIMGSDPKVRPGAVDVVRYVWCCRRLCGVESEFIFFLAHAVITRYY